MSLSFTRMASELYSTKRNAVSGGVTTRLVANLSDIYGTPLMPVTTEIRDQYQLQSPRQHYVIYFNTLLDVLPGDYITYDEQDMPVRGVGPWPTDRAFLEVIVEDVR